MGTETVLKHIEDVIRISKLEMKKQKKCKSDQMRQLTGLVNAYTRLKFKVEEQEKVNDTTEHGDPKYYDSLRKGPCKNHI